MPWRGPVVDRLSFHTRISIAGKFPFDKFPALSDTMQFAAACKEMFVLNGSRGKGAKPDDYTKLQIYWKTGPLEIKCFLQKDDDTPLAMKYLKSLEIDNPFDVNTKISAIRPDGGSANIEDLKHTFETQFGCSLGFDDMWDGLSDKFERAVPTPTAGAKVAASPAKRKMISGPQSPRGSPIEGKGGLSQLVRSRCRMLAGSPKKFKTEVDSELSTMASSSSSKSKSSTPS